MFDYKLQNIKFGIIYLLQPKASKKTTYQYSIICNTQHFIEVDCNNTCLMISKSLTFIGVDIIKVAKVKQVLVVGMKPLFGYVWWSE